MSKTFNFTVLNQSGFDLNIPIIVNPKTIAPAAGTLYQDLFPVAQWVFAVGEGQKSPSESVTSKFDVFVGPQISGNIVTAAAVAPSAPTTYQATKNSQNILSLKDLGKAPPVGASVGIQNATGATASMGVSTATPNTFDSVPIFVYDTPNAFDLGIVADFEYALVPVTGLKKSGVFTGSASGPWVEFHSKGMADNSDITVTWGPATIGPPYGVTVSGTSEANYTIHPSTDSPFSDGALSKDFVPETLYSIFYVAGTATLAAVLAAVRKYFSVDHIEVQGTVAGKDFKLTVSSPVSATAMAQALPAGESIDRKGISFGGDFLELN